MVSSSILKAKRKNIRISRLACYAAILYPFLNYYGYGNLTFSFVMIFLLFIYVIKSRGHITFAYPIFIISYMAYLCIMRVLCNITSFSDMLALSLIYIFILYGFFNKEIALPLFLRIYRWTVFVNILFFIFQECLYTISGYRVLGILTWLPSTIGSEDFDVSQYEELSMHAERSSAFFSEPAHFVQFMLPLLVIELFYVGDKKAYIRSFIYLLTLLALSSGNALLGISIIGLFFITKLLKQFHPVIGIFTILFFVAGVVFTVNKVLKTEYGEKLMDRSEELDSNSVQVSSGFLRIFRGYYIWDEMTGFEKTIGLNSETKLEEKIRQCSVAATFKDNDRYMNAAQSFLISTGYIGTLIFLLFLISLWRHNNLAGRCCIAIYVALSFIASIYFTYTMVLYLLVAFLMKKETSTPKMRTLTLRFV